MVSKPGDYVEFRAETDGIVGLSTVRSTSSPPCNGYHCSP
jgi:uncharacterized protein YcgI (DUF1989 family)